MSEIRAALVDPFTSGQIYIDAFARHRVQCVMVDSGQPVAERFRNGFDVGTYDLTVTHRGNLEETAARLLQLGVVCVAAGSELGVALADQLAEIMNLPGNGTRLSSARREKDLMAQAVASTGAAPAFTASAQLEDLLQWLATRQHIRPETRQHTPVVFKPVASSGSDGVALCRSEADVAKAFASCQSRPNMLGLSNQRFMLQEFLKGEEFVIDTVSCAAQHRVAAFWRYLKPNQADDFVGYDGIELLPIQGAQATSLIQKTAEVLDALGVCFGPAHTEMMWSNGRPMLIESGCRPHGGDNPRYAGRCLGINQLELAAQAWLEPSQFLQDLALPYRLKAHATVVFLRPAVSGILRAVGDLDTIRCLASCDQLVFDVKVGEPVSGIVGIVYLIHANKATVDADLAAIRAYEAEGLYQIDQEAGV